MRLLALLLLPLFACTDAPEAVPQAPAEAVALTPGDSLLHAGIEAHGGLAAWQRYGTLAYDLVRPDERETHLVDLRDRNVRVEAADFTIGAQGRDVWITPDTSAYDGNARFYSSLYFYFFAIPYVLADPGANAERLPARTLDGTTYDVVKVSYDAGVGDSPDDYYIAHFDQTTGQLGFILYTVTFGKDGPNERFGSLKYDAWQTVGGVEVPAQFTSYRWDAENETFGARRGTTRFENVRLDPARPDASAFAPPPGAIVLPPEA